MEYVVAVDASFQYTEEIPPMAVQFIRESKNMHMVLAIIETQYGVSRSPQTQRAISRLLIELQQQISEIYEDWDFQETSMNQFLEDDYYTEPASEWPDKLTAIVSEYLLRSHLHSSNTCTGIILTETIDILFVDY